MCREKLVEILTLPGAMPPPHGRPPHSENARTGHISPPLNYFSKIRPISFFRGGISTTTIRQISEGSNGKIVMHKNIPEPDDLAPRDQGIILPRFFLNPAGCLSKNLEVVHDPYLNQFIALKRSFSLSRISLNVADGLRHIRKTQRIVPQRGIASARIRFRT